MIVRSRFILRSEIGAPTATIALQLIRVTTKLSSLHIALLACWTHIFCWTAATHRPSACAENIGIVASVCVGRTASILTCAFLAVRAALQKCGTLRNLTVSSLFYKCNWRRSGRSTHVLPTGQHQTSASQITGYSQVLAWRPKMFLALSSNMECVRFELLERSSA